MDQFRIARDVSSPERRDRKYPIEPRAAWKDHPLIAGLVRKLAVTSLASSWVVAMSTGPAFAHASERAFILLLPTGYYLLGGTLAVAATFVALRYVKAGKVSDAFGARLRIATIIKPNRLWFSVPILALCALLLLAGWAGPRDPLENALPTSFWTLWWVGLTLIHALVGNLWGLLNPLRGADWLMEKSRALLWRVPRKSLTYPDWLGYWPVVFGFFCFAWFELVFPAPEDPDLLANAILCYVAFNLLAMRVFGCEPWLERGEPMSVFFRLVAGLSPMRMSQDESASRKIALELVVPGSTLIANSPRRFDFALFVLLVLSSVSFDGLSRTFWWLSIAGVNPLEFPGRTAMVGWNSLGLAAMLSVLALLYFVAEVTGSRLAPAASARSIYAAVVSLVPISLGFHGAHYLTSFMVNVQYSLLALSDPFQRGWDLLGIGDHHVTTSFLNNASDVSLIWNVQAIAIVMGHILAVIMAQALSRPSESETAPNWIAQAPLAGLMIVYTLFGLWLLSTPVAA